MFQEFTTFIVQYNVIGLAVWLVIGAQVTALASSFIDDLVTPLILSPMFTKMKVDHLEELSWHGVLYGKLLSNIIKFFVIAGIVFLLVQNFEIPKK